MTSEHSSTNDFINEPILSHDEIDYFCKCFSDLGSESLVQEDGLISEYGDSGDSLFLMMEGEAVVEVPVGNRWLNVALLRTGTVIGEISFLDDQPRTARVRARTRCRLFNISRDAFNEMAESNANVAFQLVQKISKILAYRLRRIEQFDAVEQGRREMRSELAADLHDRTMSDLSGILMNLGLLKFSLSPSDTNESTIAEVDDIVAMVKQADQTLRNLVREKGHDDVLLRGLDGSMNALLSDISKEESLKEISIEYETVNLLEESIPGHISEDIFQIVRQSTINAVEHAECSNINICISWGTEGISFNVSDDGIGFSSDKISNVPETGHFGLLNLKLRAERIGGTLEIQTASGEGTKISGFVPITRKTSDSSEKIIKNYFIGPS